MTGSAGSEGRTGKTERAGRIGTTAGAAGDLEARAEPRGGRSIDAADSAAAKAAERGVGPPASDRAGVRGGAPTEDRTGRTRVKKAWAWLIIVVACVAVSLVRADEGMWPLNRVPTREIQQRYGTTLTPDWLAHARLSSVRLANGCSGSFVSSTGLVMTNYHCVVGCVEALSTPAQNVQRDGFVAATDADERRCPGLEVNQLTEVTDVTARVREATKSATGESFRKARDSAFAAIERECATGDEVRCDVVTLYRGGRYDLYKSRRYQDVRLVFVPEFDVGFFGGDPDNFMFPRYNLDAAFLRVYERGVPLQASHWFDWSTHGAAAGDLVFVTGHPGSTSRLYTVSQLEFDRDVSLPANLMYLSELRGSLMEFRRRGPEEERVADAQLVFIENSLKVGRGEFAALATPALMDRKQAEEAALKRSVSARRDLPRQFGSAWDEVQAAVQRRREAWPRSTALARLGGSRLVGYAQTLVRLADEQAKPNEQRLSEFRDAALPAVRQRLGAAQPVNRTLETVQLAFILRHIRERLGLDDPAVKALLGKRSPDEVAIAAMAKTELDTADARTALMSGGRAGVEASSDPLIKLARAVDPFAREARLRLENLDATIERASGLIAQARFAVSGESVYPDATFTLRLTFGTVKGWTENGREVPPFTTLGGLFDRHTGSPPFALPRRWLDRRNRVKLDTRFNLVADTDIIGGNSGSPLIDRDGRIVGLVFDGNIHSIGGEYWFDQARNRTVAVDSRGLREALGAVYDADRVLKELSPR